MMSCRKATTLMSQQLDRPLGGTERMALQFHLMMCSGCTNFNKNMMFLRAVCGQASGKS
ncbi:zf-HC2 domain-containing protein [Noviherbaspirillum sp. CPCC 100848]|uniref:Zf-HC2 domain-containing protein n=1 Tax=Noviherbaspirillum album TaxID=3080276 RepID=A0ABU6J1W9_9BURK|nr:zf-HC2 domain-containing protein [Noviherbaspirillum sp. CPCC 100848]MEC4717623.1 zf-HC2 domain-containing protein [Noviherbaspirillum sp. CPCC 100848]